MTVRSYTINKLILTFILTVSNAFLILGQQDKTVSISGVIAEKNSGTPLEFATVIIKNRADTAQMQGTVTDKKGSFIFRGLLPGEYRLTFSFIGFEKGEKIITADSKQSKMNLGTLEIFESSLALSEVQVTATRSTFVNSIDRKTFNVGQDLMSKTGSVSDLLQNVPSLQVDIDGNITLRGSQNVTILVNGKPSAMMNLNPAAVLQQMQASSVEKIEIITNPSAKYKPDGTAGIINIVTKKDKNSGLNGAVSANYGNDNRYNTNLMFNYNPGKINYYGSIGLRHDDRTRINDITTQQLFDGLEISRLKMKNTGNATPTSELGNLGLDIILNERNRISAGLSYNHRYQKQIDNSGYTRDSLGTLTSVYSRDRVLPEVESELELSSSFLHKFKKEGHELNVNITNSFGKENEDNYYTNTYTFPSEKYYYDNMFYHHRNNVSQLLAEYINPLSKISKLEAGYELDYSANDMDLHRDTTAVDQSVFYQDFSRSSRFKRSEFTNVLYFTFEHEIGQFGFLGGLRAEQTFTKADLVTTKQVLNSRYSRIYPSLHLSYKVSEGNELQLNYSHRIRRPEDEQLNPFPEYQDLLNMRKGNPYLKPEDIHSLELGYQVKKKSTTFISTLYYRYNYNGITSILTTKGDTVISTLQNLSKNKSAGLELILSTSIGKIATLNLGSNTFYNTIDASDLGLGQNKSDITFTLTGSLGINLTKSTVWQITSNYNGEQLTPQGKRLPSFVLNTGMRQDLFKKKASLILTVSDLFNSLRNNYQVLTPELIRYEYRRRSSRIIYLGFTMNFGNSGKKQNGNSLKYDNQI